MLWLKGFHVIAVVTWFAGLFYLPGVDPRDAEQDESSDEGHEEAGGLAGLIVADGATKECP